MAASVATEAPTPAVSGRARPVFTRVEATGLLLVALAPAVMIASALVIGQSIGEEIVFFGAVIAIPAIAAALVWRFGTWARIVGIVAAIAGAMGMFWTVFGLAFPASFADFVPGVLVPVGFLMALGGGIASLVQQRRGHLEYTRTRGETRLLVAAAVVVGLAVVTSGVMTLTGRTTVEASAAALTSTMKDFAFTEASYTVPAGEATAVRVHNADAFAHTFTVPGLGIDEVVLPGSSKLVEINAPAGEYVLYCVPHANADNPDRANGDMAATIIAQ
jgi:plastocyanin